MYVPFPAPRPEGYLEDLRQSEGARSVWLFHDATHALYEAARRRVYVLWVPPPGSAAQQPGGTAAAVALGTGAAVAKAAGRKRKQSSGAGERCWECCLLQQQPVPQPAPST